MRINLNREKLNGLHELVQYLLNEFPAGDNAEELIDTLINKVRIKMRNRLETYSAKNSYGVTLTKEEALAYHLWMGQVAPLIPPTYYVFEQNVSTELTNKIDMTYGTLHRVTKGGNALPAGN